MRIPIIVFLIHISIIPLLMRCGGPVLNCRNDDASCNSIAFLSVFGDRLFTSCSTQELVFQLTPSADAGSNWGALGFGSGINRLVSLAGGAAPTVAMTSPDGINWGAGSGVAGEEWRDVAGANGVIVGVAITTNAITRSTDGVNFSPVAGPTGLWKGLTTGNGLFVAVDQDSGSASSAMVSSDGGLNWTPSTTNGGLQWFDVAFGNGIFVAVGNSATAVMTSPDGAVWTSVPGAPVGDWRAVTFGNGMFVALAASGVNPIMTSTDGTNWTAGPAPAGHPWYQITYGEGRFVGIATGGADPILTSTDGVLWNVQSSPTAESLQGIAYDPVNRRFAGVGTNGAAIYANCF
ncbi:MAG TPA: hypothetical protein DEA96_13160 [Leptospiraceae bacterium]|nr:hypothetical protein [Spirochaetaceae bacterium]HBS05911.1 hypothetical protein [Leptospiraceae bacterium]